MSLESQVLELFKMGDPAQGVAPEHALVVDPDTYLDSLHRVDMDPAGEGIESDPRRWGWLIAASIAAVLGLVFWLSSVANDQAPTATDPPVPTTTSVVPSTSPVDLWEQIPTGIAGQGGDFRSDEFAVPFKIELPVGWVIKHDEEPTAFALGPSRECTETRGPGRDCAGEFYVFVSTQDVDATVSALVSLDGTTSSEPIEATVGGAAGVTFDMTTSTDQPFIADVDGEDWSSVIVLPPDLLRVYVVDVDGQTVAFQALALDAPDFADEADAVIQTLEWRDLLP